MATKPKAPVTKKTTKPATKAVSAAKPATAAPAIKPVKTTFTKPALVSFLVEQSGVESKDVKAVLAALEQTMLGAAGKKGVGEFMLPGLLKITTQKVAAKKKRVGKNPFTGEMQEFAAKPATVRVKIRALKKLKDAAL